MTHILTHSADHDGHCSGAVLRKSVVPDACMVHGWDYGMPIDPLIQKVRDQPGQVIMADISWPLDKMRELQDASGKKLIWIDHHASAIQDLGDEFEGLRREGDAACELCWEWAFKDNPVPRVVTLLGRYDVWDHESEPDALPFQYGIKTIRSSVDPTKPESWETWEKLFSDKDPDDDGPLERLIETGHKVKRYCEGEDKLRAATAQEIDFADMKVIAINGVKGSQAFDSIWDPSKYDAMVSYTYTGSGTWSFGMYYDGPNEHVDLSTVAKKFGGGGHKRAVGWKLSTDDLIKFLQGDLT